MKLKKSNTAKALMGTLLFIGVGLSSCKKEIEPIQESNEKRGIETWKTLEDYPSEITLDNWEEFVYAPKEVIAHFQKMEAQSYSSNNLQKSITPNPGDGLAPLGPTGLIQFFSGSGMVQFPGVTVTNCTSQVVSNNLNMPNNYAMPGNCNFDPNICMAVNPPVGPTGLSCDISEPLAGVTTLDIVLIQKHILGLEVLEEPAQLLAADVSRNGVISGQDIIYIQRLILGKDLDWQESQNYLFIDSSVYPNIDWWEIGDFAENPPCDNVLITDRIGIKTGDVDGSLANCF